MISVIIPVYNVEPYLRKCLDSVINQTYRDLEILVIDDGSTDECGRICDEYEKKDERIHVFHTENRGLSCARNLGLDNARGEWIGFVDSDDWIEPDMYEVLLKKALETGADISCCGSYLQYADREIPKPITCSQKCVEGIGLTPAAMKDVVFGRSVWNKLYKMELFDNCRFPDGMLFEDIATVWKLIIRCQRVACIYEVLYHHTVRKDSISNTKSAKNLTDRWIAFKERYDVMASRNDELNLICTRNCLDTIGYTWRWLYIVKDMDEEIIEEMRSFAKAHIDFSKCCSGATRIALLCAVHSNLITTFSCYYLNKSYRCLRGLEQMI